MPTEPAHPGDHRPLTDLSYQILLSLGPGPMHGYGILKAIAARTEGGRAPETGTLYTAIRRLEKGGLLLSEEIPAAGRRGRTYRLSDLGGRVLRAESHRLARLVAEARALRLLDGTALG